MKVTVLFFASLREAAGTPEIAVEIPSGSSVGDLWPHLVEQCPALAKHHTSLAWAVNHAYAPATQPLSEGDVVAALPPISGGSEGASSCG